MSHFQCPPWIWSRVLRLCFLRQKVLWFLVCTFPERSCKISWLAQHISHGPYSYRTSGRPTWLVLCCFYLSCLFFLSFNDRRTLIVEEIVCALNWRLDLHFSNSGCACAYWAVWSSRQSWSSSVRLPTFQPACYYLQSMSRPHSQKDFTFS